MRKLAIPASLPPALAALERALGTGGRSALDPAVPTAIWRRALAGPASEFLARPGKALRTTVVRAGWLLAGGDPHAMPAGLPLAIELLHAGSLIVDDIEDGSALRRGAPTLHQLVGVPLAINTGNWMYFWALGELAGLGLAPEVELAAYRSALSTLIRCHQGQALDLSVRVTELDPHDVPAVVAATTRLKTGALCKLAAELGALAAGGAPEVTAAIGAFGEAAGIALQMLDDLGSLTSRARRDKGREDLRAARATWPWAWLAELDVFAWHRLTARPFEGASDHELDAVADALAEQIAPTGRVRIHDALARAGHDLRAAVSNHALVDAILAELARMETSYG